MNVLRSPLTWIWLLLATLTAVSFALGLNNRAHATQPAVWSAAALVLISFAKVRLIVFHFMEVRHAPWPLRRVCDAWMVLVAGAILLTYLGVGQPADDIAAPSAPASGDWQGESAP